MFTKSQLVATAVLVASASSVVASPIYNDVTDMEARSYTRDALTELKRRAVLEYLEELEARAPPGKVAGAAAVAHAIHPALANGGKSHQTSSAVSGEKHKQITEGSRHSHAHPYGGQTTTHKQQHLASGHREHASEKIHKTSGHGTTVHHGSNNNRLSATHGSSAHGQGSHSGQPSTSDSKKVIKRSVLEYLEDLVGRAPTENTQSTSASDKAPHLSAVTGGHKETVAHGRHGSKVVGGHKEIGAHGQHTSNAAGGHKEAGLHTQHPSSHRHKDLETSDHKGSKYTTLRPRPHSRPSRPSLHTKQRVHALSHERTAILGGHKEATGNDHHRLAPSRANSPVNHERVKTGEERTSSSNTPATHPASQKQQTLRTREFEELAELIARELDLYDELD